MRRNKLRFGFKAVSYTDFVVDVAVVQRDAKDWSAPLFIAQVRLAGAGDPVSPMPLAGYGWYTIHELEALVVTARQFAQLKKID